MGQAKLRGSIADRIAHSKARKDALRPTKMKCNDCGSKITEIYDLESRGLIGITGAYVGKCSKCEYSTIGMSGDPERVNYYMEAYIDFLGISDPVISVQTKKGIIINS